MVNSCLLKELYRKLCQSIYESLNLNIFRNKLSFMNQIFNGPEGGKDYPPSTVAFEHPMAIRCLRLSTLEYMNGAAVAYRVGALYDCKYKGTVLLLNNFS